MKDKKNPGSFFIIEFDDEFIGHIRNELGLQSKFLRYHITVGRTYYD